ncbi:MAG TPA: PIG-L family deacetylase [Anaerolineales bacterium]|nr:PIG-L family deacetylase [Anaerolineales bacterium]
MRWIFISPHLDDAILSCGGLIHKLVDGNNIVEVWTICAGDPPENDLSSFAIKQQNDFRTGVEYYENRRSEDIDACNFLGARYRHFSFIDCIYRRSRDGLWLYDSEEKIFGSILPDDEGMIKDITLFLCSIIKQADIVVSPMSIGNHVDHQIVRIALEARNHPIIYYADFPYGIRQNEILNRIKDKPTNEIHKLSMENIAAWKDSICFYSSQMNVLFGNKENMYSSIDEFVTLLDDYQLWHQFSIS